MRVSQLGCAAVDHAAALPLLDVVLASRGRRQSRPRDAEVAERVILDLARLPGDGSASHLGLGHHRRIPYPAAGPRHGAVMTEERIATGCLGVTATASVVTPNLDGAAAHLEIPGGEQ